MTKPGLLLLATLALTALLPAQLASYKVVGSSCTSGRLMSAIGPVPFQVQGVPRIGGTFTVITEGSTNYPTGVRRMVFLATGVSNTSHHGLPLPFDIARVLVGQPFCGILRTSFDVTLRVPLVRDYRTPATVKFSVPNDRSLVGARFYQQVLSNEFTTFGPPFKSGTLSAGGEGIVGF